MDTTIKYGVLYICPTPIGNLEDITFRTVRTLKEAAVIAAEDTRHTKKLLNHFSINTPLISYHEHNKNERSDELVARLLSGEDVAVVSDAGMPGISDPGSDLVKLAIEKNIRVTPLPGPNAAVTALVASGLTTVPFTFVGFLPKTAKKRREMLISLKEHEYTLIFYEAPHRFTDTLNEMVTVFGDRPAVAARELSKKFEEFVRGSLTTLNQHFTAAPPKGELTLIVDVFTKDKGEGIAQRLDEAFLAKAVEELVLGGENKKDAIRKIASKLDLPKRAVYQAVISKR